MYRTFFIIAMIFCLPFQAGAADRMSRADSLLAAKRHVSFAVQYKNSGEYDEALRQYEKSIAFNDTVYQVHFSFAELLMRMHLPERAKAEYLRAFTLNPDHRASVSALAGLYYTAAAYDSALIMYEDLYRIAPDPAMLSGIADMREYLGKNAEALAARKQLIDSGDSSRGNLLGTSRLAMKLSDSTLALNCLEQLSRADSSNDAVLADLEKIYRARGDDGNLIRTLERRLGILPHDTGILGEISTLLFARGENGRAEEYARRGVAITPNDGQLHLVLGEIHRMRGESEKAQGEYRAALDDPQWSEDAKRLLDSLEQPAAAANGKEREFFTRKKSKETGK